MDKKDIDIVFFLIGDIKLSIFALFFLHIFIIVAVFAIVSL